METVRTPFAAAVVLCLAAPGCRRNLPYPVERLEIGSPGALRGVGWKGSRADLEAAVKGRLGAAGFVLHDGSGREPAPEGAIRLALELTAAQGAPVRVGVLLQVRRRSDPAPASYQVNAVGEGSSAQGALEKAIERVLRGARLQLLAAAKSDEDLVKDLASSDSAVHLSAVRVLTDRRNPAVVQALLDQLGSDDLDEVRRAIGALVELKERRAVPPLIELGSSRDLGFLLEVLYALGEIGGDEAQAYLYTVAQGHDQAAVREVAQQALDELSRSEQKPDRGLSSREGGGEAARH